jgi:uncharacterized Fe-S cluster-containing protein
MNVLKINIWGDIPENYTGIVEHPNGIKIWYLNGQRHRLDGPAIEYKNGDKYWFLNGFNYSQEEWFELLSEEDKLNAIWNLR